MSSRRKFTRPQGKKLTGIAKRHPRAISQSLDSDDDASLTMASPRFARRILVVDGDTEAIADIAFALAGASFRVSTALTTHEALSALRRERYDLIVLGSAIGGSSGIELLRRLRAQTRPEVFGTQTDSVGVVMIVDATNDNPEAARHLALTQGADDVMTRPFTTPDLLARIAPILRRAPHVSKTSHDVFRIGELFVDFAGHNVMVEDNLVDLTRRELALLRALAENSGQLCTREYLTASGNESTRAAPTRTIDMQISRLRRKLGVAGAMIHSVRGEGYRLARVRAPLHP